MKRADNRGLSLLELVIAIALLALVSTMLLGFMTTGSTMFRRISTDISLQMDAQIAMTQLREYVIDCNDTLRYNESARTLTVLNSDASGAAQEHIFVWDEADGTLRYNGDPLAERIAAFHLIQMDGAVEITLVFSHLAETHRSTQTVALRNDAVAIDFS